MSPRKEFEEFYNNELKELLTSRERVRKAAAVLAVLGSLSMVSAIIGFFIGGNSSNQALMIVAFVLLIIGVVLLILFYNKRKNYISWFKENIVHSIIKFIDPGLRYDPVDRIHKEDYKLSGLYLEGVDRYRGDDYVEGKRGETLFCFSELHTEKKITTGKTTTWQTIFKGLFFIGDFNKNFHGRTYVYSENNPQLNFFTKMLSSFAWDLEKVKLESIEFENRFIVYSNDQVEARYILTPSFMERLVRLQELMGDHTSYSFVDTNIYVAVPVAEELFEPSIFSRNDSTTLANYFNTIHIVFDIIDELNLNLRIWNKE